MKKLFFFLCCFFSVQSFAQQIFFAQDFESYTSYQILGWENQFSGAVPWQTGLPYLVGGLCNNWPGVNRIAGIPDCGMFDYDNSSVLIKSPYIHLSTTNSAWLQYDSYFKGITIGNNTEKATVEITKNNGLTWDTLQLVPADTTPLMITYYIDLAAYIGFDSLKLGFRYNDGGGHLKGWEIDNIKVFKPSPKDLQLLYTTPTDSMLSYKELNNVIIHQAEVFNYSLDTITQFTATYITGSGIAHAYQFTNIQILPYTKYAFTHPIPDTIFSIGKQKVTMWIDVVGDNIHSNDTAVTYINGANFIPQKLLVIEEGTGTWNVWGPRGWVLMNTIFDNEYNICEVSAHSSDSMSDVDYSDFLFFKGYNYVPFFLFDRRKNVSPDSFLMEIDRMQQYFGFANITSNSILTGNDLKVNVTVSPAIEMTGDFRIALMITEDNVHHTSASYNQRNSFAGGFYGPMGGFENKPDPVPASDMYYNFVARKIEPDNNGAPNSLPSTLTFPNSYYYTLNTTLNPTWNKARLKAYVFLINNADSTILNSKRISFSSPVATLADAEVKMGVFPNPANELAIFYLDIPNSEKISWSLTDLTGKTVLYQPPTLMSVGYHEIQMSILSLESGLYLLNATSDNFRKTLKLQVIH